MNGNNVRRNVRSKRKQKVKLPQRKLIKKISRNLNQILLTLTENPVKERTLKKRENKKVIDQPI